VASSEDGEQIIGRTAGRTGIDWSSICRAAAMTLRQRDRGMERIRSSLVDSDARV
jgi:hypothetical protein